MSWPLVKLGEVVSVKGGKRLPKGSDYSEEITAHPYIRVCDMSNGRLKTPDSELKYISDEVFEHIKRYTISSEDVYISIAGTIGIVGCIPQRLEGANLTENAAKLVVKDPCMLSKDFLVWFLSTKGKAGIKGRTKSTSQPKLALFRIEELEIPLPPLAEQKRIAVILDKADAIRCKLQQALELADEFLRSVFLDMFGDPVTNPKGWKLEKLGNVTDSWKGGASIKPEDFTESGFPVLHKGAIQKNGDVILDSSKKTFVSPDYAAVKKNSLIGKSNVAITLRDLVPSGPSIGLMADLSDHERDEYLLSQGAYGFSINKEKLHASYLVALSNHKGFRQQFRRIAVGSTQIHIRSTEIKELYIPVPPVDLQLKYSSIRRAIIGLKNSEVFGGEDRLFSALSQKAFEGEL